MYIFFFSPVYLLYIQDRINVLYEAAENDLLRVVELLIAAKVDVNIQEEVRK